MMSSGSSFWMIAISRLMVSGVSAGKAEDVARQRHDALRLPGEQHLAVFGDLVLALLGGCEIVRIDVLQADEDPRDACPLGLLHEVLDPVAQRIDLDHQAERDPVLLPQLDQAVEDRLPFLVAREIVVGDEEFVDALRPVHPHQPLHVVGGTEARFAALHVDDGAERALIGAAAARIETRAEADRVRDILLRQERHRHAFDAGQVLHEIVERCELARRRIAQHRLEPAFGLAGKHGNAHFATGVEPDRVTVQHGQASRDMEAAHGDRQSGVAERPGDVERARILVGLNADQRDHSEIAVRAKFRQKGGNVDPRIGLVDRHDVDGDFGPEHPAIRTVGGDAIERGERIRRDHRSPPADDIAVVVVM